MCKKRVLHQNLIGRSVATDCGQVHLEVGPTTIRFDRASFYHLRSLVNLTCCQLEAQRHESTLEREETRTPMLLKKGYA